MDLCANFFVGVGGIARHRADGALYISDDFADAIYKVSYSGG